MHRAETPQHTFYEYRVEPYGLHFQLYCNQEAVSKSANSVKH